MKRLLARIICTIFMISFSTMVFGNSGPVYWEGYPSSDILSIEGNSPISVESENLVFDFSHSGDSSYTIDGKVTATYEMLNPTEDTQTVQMAFPFVDSLDSLVTDDIVITSDDSIVLYDIYFGDVVNSHGSPMQDEKETSFDFSSIVGSITDKTYKAKNFTENEKGRLYIINVKPTTDQRINFTVDFSFNHEKTKVITNGFNRYERNDKKTRIAAWCYEPENLEVYVLGEDIDLNISAYTDGELKKKTDLYTYEISTQEVEVIPYLMNDINNNINETKRDIISDTQLYNLYAKSLDEYLTRNRGYYSKYSLVEQMNLERILTLVYTVEFPRNSKKEISVSYNTSGTMDRTETVEPLYSFDYILNPAKNWSDFKNLNIKVIASKQAPYIVKSNIKWTKEEDRIYTAHLEDLPEEDLSFTLYRDEKITLMDKVEGSFNNIFGYFSFIILGIISILIIGVIIGVIILRKR